MKTSQLKPCKRKKCPYYYIQSSNCNKCEWNPSNLWTKK